MRAREEPETSPVRKARGQFGPRVQWMRPGPVADRGRAVEQGYPYKPGYNIAEFLLDTLVESEGSAFSLYDEQETDGDEHSFATYYANSELAAENLRELTASKVRES